MNMKKFYFLMCAVIAVVLHANAGMITDKPNGTSKMYERSEGLSYIFDGSDIRLQNQYGFTEIIFGEDGKTVYIQDPIAGFSVGDGIHTWIEGSLSADGKTLTFPMGQQIWEDNEGGPLAIAVLDKDESSHALAYNRNASISEVTYTIEGDKVILSGTSEKRILGIVSKLTGAWVNFGEYGTVYKEYMFNDPVTPPAGIELNTFRLSAVEHMTEQWYTTEVKVGFVGNDVYIQGLNKYLPGAWVKGTLNEKGTIATIPIQYMGQDAVERRHFLVGWNTGVGGVADLQLNYYKDMNAFEATAPVVINSNPTMMNYYVYYSSLFIGNRPDPVSAPEDIECKTMTMKGETDILGLGFTADPFERKVKVGVKDGTVYFQGLSETMPEAWAVGTLENGKVTIPQGQFIGVSETTAVYLLGADGETGRWKDFVFSYDEAKNVYSSEDILYECSVMVPSSFLIKYMPGIVISDDAALSDINPDELPAMTCTFSGTYNNKLTGEFNKAFTKTVYMAVSGNYVFMKGMFDVLPNAWVVGTMTDATTATFKGAQKLGTVDGTDYYFSGLDVNVWALADCVLKYDEAAKKYTFDTSAVINKSETAVDYTYWYNPNSVITVNSLGVESIDADDTEKEEVIYNMQGIQVQRPLSSGLYIINGKKVLIR